MPERVIKMIDEICLSGPKKKPFPLYNVPIFNQVTLTHWFFLSLFS